MKRIFKELKPKYFIVNENGKVISSYYSKANRDKVFEKAKAKGKKWGWYNADPEKL